MNPFFKVLSIALPSVIAGGLLFQSALGHADEKGEHKHKHKHKHDDGLVIKSKNGDSVTINGHVGLSALDGIRAMVRGRLAGARTAILHSNMPPQLRDRALARFDKVNAIVNRKLTKIDLSDLDQLGEQMEELGEEIEEAMEGIEDELEELAKSDPTLRRQLKQLGGDLKFEDNDGDGDDDSWGLSMPVPPVPPVPPVAPVAPVPPVPPLPPLPPGPIAGWSSTDVPGYNSRSFDGSDLKLRPDQRTSLRAVRQQSDATISVAKKELDKLSAQLDSALRNKNTAPNQALRLVDAISAQEAIIRKARVSAWLQSRALLDDDQRATLERGQ